MRRKELVKVQKAAWEISQHTKTTVAQNVIAAFTRKEIRLGDNVNVNKDVLPKLVMILNSSINQAYMQAVKNFEKTLEKTVDDIIDVPESKKN